MSALVLSAHRRGNLFPFFQFMSFSNTSNEHFSYLSFSQILFVPDISCPIVSQTLKLK